MVVPVVAVAGARRRRRSPRWRGRARTRRERPARRSGAAFDVVDLGLAAARHLRDALAVGLEDEAPVADRELEVEAAADVLVRRAREARAVARERPCAACRRRGCSCAWRRCGCGRRSARSGPLLNSPKRLLPSAAVAHAAFASPPSNVISRLPAGSTCATVIPILIGPRPAVVSRALLGSATARSPPRPRPAHASATTAGQRRDGPAARRAIYRATARSYLQGIRKA